MPHHKFPPSAPAPPVASRYPRKGGYPTINLLAGWQSPSSSVPIEEDDEGIGLMSPVSEFAKTGWNTLTEGNTRTLANAMEAFEVRAGGDADASFGRRIQNWLGDPNHTPMTWTDIDGEGTSMEKLLGGLTVMSGMTAQGLASMGPIAIGGGLGALAAAPLGPAASASAAKGGSYTMGVLLNLGETYQQLKEEGVEPLRASTWAIPVGTAIGMFDTLGFNRVLGAAKMKEVKSEAIRRFVLKAGVKGYGRGATEEGFTEFAQSAAREALAVHLTDTEFDLDRLLSTLNEGFAGALAGGAIGGVGRASGAYRHARRQTVTESIQESEGDDSKQRPDLIDGDGGKMDEYVKEGLNTPAAQQAGEVTRPDDNSDEILKGFGIPPVGSRIYYRTNDSSIAGKVVGLIPESEDGPNEVVIADDTGMELPPYSLPLNRGESIVPAEEVEAETARDDFVKQMNTLADSHPDGDQLLQGVLTTHGAKTLEGVPDDARQKFTADVQKEIDSKLKAQDESDAEADALVEFWDEVNEIKEQFPEGGFEKAEASVLKKMRIQHGSVEDAITAESQARGTGITTRRRPTYVKMIKAALKKVQDAAAKEEANAQTETKPTETEAESSNIVKQAVAPAVAPAKPAKPAAKPVKREKMDSIEWMRFPISGKGDSKDRAKAWREDVKKRTDDAIKRAGETPEGVSIKEGEYRDSDTYFSHEKLPGSVGILTQRAATVDWQELRGEINKRGHKFDPEKDVGSGWGANVIWDESKIGDDILANISTPGSGPFDTGPEAVRAIYNEFARMVATKEPTTTNLDLVDWREITAKYPGGLSRQSRKKGDALEMPAEYRHWFENVPIEVLEARAEDVTGFLGDTSAYDYKERQLLEGELLDLNHILKIKKKKKKKAEAKKAPPAPAQVSAPAPARTRAAKPKSETQSDRDKKALEEVSAEGVLYNRLKSSKTEMLQQLRAVEVNIDRRKDELSYEGQVNEEDDFTLQELIDDQDRILGDIKAIEEELAPLEKRIKEASEATNASTKKKKSKKNQKTQKTRAEEILLSIGVLEGEVNDPSTTDERKDAARQQLESLRNELSQEDSFQKFANLDEAMARFIEVSKVLENKESGDVSIYDVAQAMTGFIRTRNLVAKEKKKVPAELREEMVARASRLNDAGFAYEQQEELITGDETHIQEVFNAAIAVVGGLEYEAAKSRQTPPKAHLIKAGPYDQANRIKLLKPPDTPAFRAFMKGSVAVNKDGSPKIMAHSTDSWDPDESIPWTDKNEGFHVGTPDAALIRVAARKKDLDLMESRDHIRVFAVDEEGNEVDVKNLPDEVEPRWKWDHYFIDGYDETFPSETLAYKDAVSALEFDASQNVDLHAEELGDVSVIPLYVSLMNPIRVHDPGMWSPIDVAYPAKDKKIISEEEYDLITRMPDEEEAWKHLRRLLESRGIDGIEYKNQYEDKGSMSYVLWHPTQVKHAEGNTGSFDRTNPNVKAHLVEEEDGEPIRPETDEARAFVKDSVVREAQWHFGEFDPWRHGVFRVDGEGVHFGTLDASRDRVVAQIHEQYQEDVLQTIQVYRVDEGEIIEDPDVEEEWKYRIEGVIEDSEETFSSEDAATDEAYARAFVAYAAMAEEGDMFDNDDIKHQRHPYFLNIKKPLKTEDPGVWNYGTIVNALVDAKSITPEEARSIRKEANAEDDKVGFGAGWRIIHYYLDKLGFDGIEYTNKVEDKGSTSYAVFKPEQIKHAKHAMRFDAQDQNVLAHLVETPNFKQWFGNSVVVDAKGNPEVQYHGGSFNPGQDPVPRTQGGVSGAGMFFGPRDVAEFFAGMSKKRKSTSRLYGVVTPAYLSLKNPLVMKRGLSPSKKWASRALEYAIASKTGKRAPSEDQVLIYSGQRKDGPDDWSGFHKVAKKYGYDGIQADYFMRGKMNKVYIAFDPKDIKHATRNVGAFDPQNPSVLASMRIKRGGRWEKLTKNDLDRIEKRIMAAAERMVPEGVTIKVHRTAQLKAGIQGVADALYWPDTATMEIALAAQNPDKNFRHETIHVLRGMGIITDEDWGKLEATAKKRNWIDKFRIPERYKNADEHMEEAVAHGFGDWWVNRNVQPGDSAIARIFKRIAKFLLAVRIAVGIPSDERIFMDIEAGRMHLNRFNPRAARSAGGREAPGPLRSLMGEDEEKPIRPTTLAQKAFVKNSVVREAQWHYGKFSPEQHGVFSTYMEGAHFGTRQAAIERAGQTRAPEGSLGQIMVVTGTDDRNQYTPREDEDGDESYYDAYGDRVDEPFHYFHPDLGYSFEGYADYSDAEREGSIALANYIGNTLLDEGKGSFYGSSLVTGEDGKTFVDTRPVDVSNEGFEINPYFLNITKPLRVDDPGTWTPNVLAKSMGEQGVIPQNEAHEFVERYDERGADFHDGTSIEVKREKAKMFQDLREKLEAKGYDGIIYENGLEDEGSTSYIIFNPNQAKHAERNVGTYDARSPNVLAHKVRRWGDVAEDRKARLTDAEVEENRKRNILNDAFNRRREAERRHARAIEKGTATKKTTWTGVSRLAPPRRGPRAHIQEDALSENENFRRWFKGSEVVNEDGSPKVMYHGGSFNPSKDPVPRTSGESLGMYFTGDKYVADRFAAFSEKNLARKRKGLSPLKSGVTPVYLSIKNPLELKPGDLPGRVSPRFGKVGENLKAALKKRGIEMTADEEAYFDKLLATDGWYKGIGILEKYGYDGIKYMYGAEEDGTGGSVAYVAIRPQQVKHAERNLGTFDPQNSSVLARKDERGEDLGRVFDTEAKRRELRERIDALDMRNDKYFSNDYESLSKTEQLFVRDEVYKLYEKIIPGGRKGMPMMLASKSAISFFSDIEGADAFYSSSRGIVGVSYNAAIHPMGLVSHELIHALKHAGAFTNNEWVALQAESKRKGWIKRYVIDARYVDRPPDVQLEESIAEAFTEWRVNKEAHVDSDLVEPGSLIEGVFHRINRFIRELRKAIYRGLASRFGDHDAIIGLDPNASSTIFEKIESGAIGKRERARIVSKGDQEDSYHRSVKAHLVESDQDYRFENEEHEAPYQRGQKRTEKPSSLKENWESVKTGIRNFGRIYKDLPQSTVYAKAHLWLRELKNASQVAEKRIARMQKEIVGDLDEREMNIFSRAVVLNSMAINVQDGRDIPIFKRDYDAWRHEMRRIQSALKAPENAKIAAALRKRRTFNQKIAKDLVSRGVIPEKSLLDRDYFTHRVIEYMQESDSLSALADVRTPKWKKRRGTTLDISTNYLESEAYWQMQALVDIQVADTIRHFRNEGGYNRREALIKAIHKENNQGMDAKILEAVEPALKKVTFSSLKEQGVRTFDDLIDYVYGKGSFSGAKDNRTPELNAGIKRAARSVEMFAVMDRYRQHLGLHFGQLRKHLLQDGELKPEVEQLLPQRLHKAALSLNREGRGATPWKLLEVLARGDLDEFNPRLKIEALATFKVLADRTTHTRTTLGRDWVSDHNLETALKQMVRRGHDEWKEMMVWQPDKGNNFFTAMSLTDRIVEGTYTVLDDLLDADENIRNQFDSDLRDQFSGILKNATMMGGPKFQMVLDTPLATTLNEFKNEHLTSQVNTFQRKAIHMWKMAMTVSPLKVVKYNIRNVSGDGDHVNTSMGWKALNPKKINAAMKELWDVEMNESKPSELYELAEQKAVITGGYNLELMHDSREIMDDIIQSIEISSAKKAAHKINEGWEWLQKVNGVRENILRYVVFKEIREHINKHKPTDTPTPEAVEAVFKDIGFGAMKRETALGVDTWDNLAAYYSRETLGDYGNLSVNGNKIRASWIPFWSWQEINAKFYARTAVNIWRQFKEGESPEVAQHMARASLLTGKAAALYLVFRAAGFYMFQQAWNHLLWGEEEEQLTDTDQRRGHFIVGKIGDEVIMLPAPGAAAELTRWVGFEDVLAALEHIEAGRGRLSDVAEAVASGFVNTAAQGITPAVKVPIEYMMGLETFPDFLNPRKMRSRTDYLIRSAGVDSVVDIGRAWTNTGKPTQGAFHTFSRYFVDRRPTDYSAYSQIRAMGFKFRSFKSGDISIFGAMSPSDVALYNYRLALRYNDQEAVERWRKRILELRIPFKNRRAMIDRLEPMGMLTQDQRREFMRTLTPAEMRVLKRARAYFVDVFKKRG